MPASSPERSRPPLVVSDALMAAVEAAFPDRLPEGPIANDEIRERMGAARVVRFLRRLRAQPPLKASLAAGALENAMESKL